MLYEHNVDSGKYSKISYSYHSVEKYSHLNGTLESLPVRFLQAKNSRIKRVWIALVSHIGFSTVHLTFPFEKQVGMEFPTLNAARMVAEKPFRRNTSLFQTACFVYNSGCFPFANRHAHPVDRPAQMPLPAATFLSAHAGKSARTSGVLPFKGRPRAHRRQYASGRHESRPQNSQSRFAETAKAVWNLPRVFQKTGRHRNNVQSGTRLGTCAAGFGQTRRAAIHHAAHRQLRFGRTLHQPAASVPADRHVQTAENQSDRQNHAGGQGSRQRKNRAYQHTRVKQIIKALRSGEATIVLPDHVPSPQEGGKAYGWISSANLPIP